MTKKDYVLIAQAIRLTVRNTLPREHPTLERCADNIAADLARDNPKFDRARFLAACGV